MVNARPKIKQITSFLNFFLYLFIDGPGSSLQDLWPSLCHAGPLAVSCGISFPNQGLNPGPLYWELKVLATGPPGKLHKVLLKKKYLFIYFSFIFISWRLITSQYFSGFCHTLTWISHGVTCIPHPVPPSHLPLHPIPLGLPSAPGLSTCLKHPTWVGDLFHYR